VNFFVSAANAAEGPAQQGGGWEMLIMLGLFFVIFYFMLIRPQQKRAKEHKTMMDALQKGDEVLTTGGILGRVVKIKEQYVVVAINDNVEISLQRHSIAATLPKGTIASIQQA
jgi:preprotein translocase subunit YajC